EEKEHSPPNSSWPPSLNASHAKATPAVNLTFSSYYQHSSAVAAMFIVAYVLIFLLCMVGNALVCFVVLRNRHMRTVTNMFILNLAVSDLLVGIFCMPTTLVDNLITGWPFDNATCKMSGLVQGMSVSASVFTLVAIAVERFRCIVHPFREKLTPRQALVTIAVIWALALLIMCPSAVTLTVTRDEHHFMVDARNRSYPLYSCWEAWPEKGMRTVYTTVLFSHIYLAPLALIVLMYARIARKLCKASRTPKWVNPNDAAGKEQQPKLSCPLDALCPCPGVPSVLPRHLGVTLSWENTVCPSSQLPVGLLQDMFWAILFFPESYNGTSHLSSRTGSVHYRHSEFCPLGGSPEEEGGGAVLPPLLIGPTAIITHTHPPTPPPPPPPPPPRREDLKGQRWLSGHVEASAYLLMDRRKGKHSTAFRLWKFISALELPAQSLPKAELRCSPRAWKGGRSIKAQVPLGPPGGPTEVQIAPVL
uniref:Neuropeptide FF receptor 1 n=1 Tax=Ailuropoda melanoleuca TaxID=9646 RepID=G1MHM3_AILME